MPNLPGLLTTGVRPHRDNCHCPVRVCPPRPWLPRANALPDCRLLFFVSLMQFGACGPQDGALPDTRAKPFQQSKSHRLLPNEPAAESKLLRSAHLLHTWYALRPSVAKTRSTKHPSLTNLFIRICRGSRVPFQRLARPVASPYSPATLRLLVLFLG